MAKKILYLTFYFEPDLCAGSFRNSPLAAKLAEVGGEEVDIELYTTLPNRYSSYTTDASELERRNNLTIRRIKIPSHQSGMKDQMYSFYKFFLEVRRRTKNKHYDLVFASSSRLFTAYLGYTIAKKLKVPLYLDVRDIFYDTLEDVVGNRFVKKIALPIIKLIEKRTFGYAKHLNLISEGFKSYFTDYQNAEYSFFPNGIDNEFINLSENQDRLNEKKSKIKTIIYAGNIGEGQGLHKIIPHAAKELGDSYSFVVIGDGGAKKKLIEKLKDLNVQNVALIPPQKRADLIDIYRSADFLFVHLNDYKAFKRVLPSKLFELASFPQPLIAGVGGYAHDFVKKNIENSLLFAPCDYLDMVQKLRSYKYKNVCRTSFIESYRREKVNSKMAESILKLL